ncbi:MAG: hypothetical protein M1607_00745 [Patescibacteria group bacterium]|nr:hypothetical protein [Patescibacteria group bacterium]
MQRVEVNEAINLVEKIDEYTDNFGVSERGEITFDLLQCKLKIPPGNPIREDSKLLKYLDDFYGVGMHLFPEDDEDLCITPLSSRGVVDIVGSNHTPLRFIIIKINELSTPFVESIKSAGANNPYLANPLIPFTSLSPYQQVIIDFKIRNDGKASVTARDRQFNQWELSIGPRISRNTDGVGMTRSLLRVIK